MKAIVLGTGAWSGVPAWNDASALGGRARDADPTVPARRATALAVSARGERWVVCEAPFELATLLARHPAFAPTGGRGSIPLDALVVTSAELEACAGLLAIREGLAARIHSHVELKRALPVPGSPFTLLDPFWTSTDWNRPFVPDRDEGLELRIFPLPGPTPDHLRESAPGAGRARCGVRIVDRATGARLVWAPRIPQLDSGTLAELRAADVRLVDGTFLAAEDAMSVRPGVRRSPDLGHAPIDGSEGSLARLAGMQGRSIYVHVPASNPIAEVGGKDAARLRDAGVEIAHDGLEIEL